VKITHLWKTEAVKQEDGNFDTNTSFINSYECNYLRNLHEPYMNLTWILHEPYMNLTWPLHEPYMTLTWTLHELYMNLTWILHEPYMNLTWTLHKPTPSAHSRPHRTCGTWPPTHETLVNDYLQLFVKFIKSINFIDLQWHVNYLKTDTS
jgi:hypothetical protein